MMIYVGARHAISYMEIFSKDDRYKELKKILPNSYDERVSRCLSDPDFIDLLRLGPKINAIRRGGNQSELNRAEGRISDYRLNY